MTEQQQEEWLTVPQAAAIFGESIEVLKSVLKAEGTPVKHLNGGRIKVRRADVVALKASRIRPIDPSVKG